jgi:DNA-binding Lrp family transcriptional regulator
MAELIDKKDKKLLYYLSINARTSHTQLAKKVGLSKNSIKYRIERLKKEGIIKHFASVVNLGSLKYKTFTLLLKFNDDIYENKDIIEYFKTHKYADWVAILSGNWDIFVEIACRDLYHLDEIIKGIIARFGELLNTYQIYFSFDTLRVEHLIKDFYKDLKVEELPRKPRTKERYDIDVTDRKILNVLNHDSSLSYLDIAKRLNLTIDIVRYRIKNLLGKNIIVKFFPEIDLPKLGYTEYLYILKLKNLSAAKIDEVNRKIQTNPNITYAFFDINSFNLVFVCAFKSPEGIDHLSRELRREYKEIIEEQNYLIIKEQVLFNLFPEGLLET